MLHSYLSSFEIINNHFGLLKQQAAIGLTFHEDIRFFLPQHQPLHSMCISLLKLSQRYSSAVYTRQMK